MQRGTFAPVRDIFRAVAITIVPEAEALDDSGWSELESAIEKGLETRPESMRRQLRLFVHAIDFLPLFRFARKFRSLDSAKRTAFLLALQDSPLLLLRRGFWGLRTLVFMGYYGRDDAQRTIGYRADPRGWEVRR
jgi:hypothetical protein